MKWVRTRRDGCRCFRVDHGNGRSTLMFKQSLVIAAALTLFGIAPAARAQWAVIDVGAIAQLMQEVQQMQQALQTAQNQLNQAQQTYQSMTGGRGMQLLLSGTVRNYLPGSWAQVSTALAGPIQAIVNANAALTAQQWAELSPAEQQQL